MNRFPWRFLRPAAVGFVMASLGVASPVDAVAVKVGSFQPWQRVSDSYPITICWSGGSPADRLTAQNALVQTWQAHSGIVFTFQECPLNLASLAKEVLSVQLNYDPEYQETFGAAGGTGWAGVESTSSSDFQVAVGYGQGSGFGSFEGTVVHEVGHALGWWYHEHERADYGAQCPADMAKFTAAASDIRYLTIADRCEEAGICSIMAPWPCNAARRRLDGGGIMQFWGLSSLDILGIAMLYPQTLTPRVTGSAAYTVASGVVSRADGSLMTSWTWDGAHPQAFGAPSWKSGGTVIATGYTCAAASLPQESNSVSVSFKDWLKRSHSGTTSVTVSNELHTALTLGLVL